MAIRLHIHTTSPVSLSDGFGSAGIADREVVAASDGLPFIPGRRLKGLLRDGYRSLAVCQDAGFQPADPDFLFGEPGAAAAGAVSIADATLDGTEELRPWLKEHKIGASLVLDAHTVLRRQTKIDERTGIAADDTLRVVRCLREGLHFYAPLEPLKHAELRAVALAAAALQTAGVSRNRGTGQVACTLEELRGEKWEDVTAEALASIGQASKADDEAASDEESAPKVQDDEELHCLRYQISLRSNALFPVQNSDAFTVETSESVPGSSVRGAFAARYLMSGRPASDPAFAHLFCGPVRFGPATLMPESLNWSSTQPIPRMFRLRKGTDGDVWNLAEGSEQETGPTGEDPQFRRLEGWCDWESALTGLPLEKLVPETELRYHHARAADRRKQRATGTSPEEGALFTYRSLKADQEFGGEILGNRAALEALQQLIPSGESLRLGRSRSAEYGGAAVLEWAEPEVYLGAVYGASQEEPGEEEWTRFAVILSTPLTCSNGGGRVTGAFPVEDLADLLEVTAEELQVEQQFARTAIHGSYLAHLNLPRSQAHCFEPGSVWVFTSVTPLRTEQLRKATLASLGSRVEDGFGRFAIKALRAKKNEPDQRTMKDGEGRIRSTADGYPTPAGSKRAEFARMLFREHVAQATKHRALAHAEKLAGGAGRLSPALLRRLVHMLDHSKNVAEFSSRFPFPEPQKHKAAGGPNPGVLQNEQLRKLERTAGLERKSLRGMLASAAEDKVFVNLVREAWMEGWSAIYEKGNPMVKGDQVLDQAAAQFIPRLYLRTLLSALARSRSQSAGGN